MLLLLRERHTVRGSRAEEFAATWREGLAPALERAGLGRLLWFLDQPHGSGPAYTVVTYTALAGGAAWEDLAMRASRGDLRDTVDGLDQMRYEVSSTLLAPLPWSPLRPAGLDDLPPPAAGAAPGLYMEDTVTTRPGMFQAYLEGAGARYAPRLGPNALLTLVSAATPAWGGGPADRAVLFQRVNDPARLVDLIAHGSPPGDSSRDDWMSTALTWRDRWRSRLLRPATWSPLQ